MEFKRTPARWQTVYFPQHILDGWRRAAEEEGAKVSMYDLFASWLHMVSDSRLPPLDYTSNWATADYAILRDTGSDGFKRQLANIS